MRNRHPKTASPREMEQAIRAAIRGETFLSPMIAKDPKSDYARLMQGEHSLLRKLTPRQQDVLRLIAEGRSTREIAKELGISVKTVETHRAQIMDRLGVFDVVGLVRCAIRDGLVKLGGGLELSAENPSYPPLNQILRSEKGGTRCAA